MQYICDNDKNVTHVIVPIDEWESMLEKAGSAEEYNPYQPVIDWLKEVLEHRAQGSEMILLGGLAMLEGSSPDSAQKPNLELFKVLPTYKLLLYVLENNYLQYGGGGVASQRFTDFKSVLNIFYSYVETGGVKEVAEAYILRNKDFMAALQRTKAEVEEEDKNILESFGFDVDRFKHEASNELQEFLYKGYKTEFIFMAMYEDINRYFRLIPHKDRLRREPEILRFFFYDIFNTLDEILVEKSEFKNIFKKYPLVDKLAKAIYPSNTLSGATSRVYKATNEARKIINSEWKKYATPE